MNFIIGVVTELTFNTYYPYEVYRTAFYLSGGLFRVNL